MPRNPSDEPAAQAHALLERLFALVHDCRAVVPQLEAASTDPESVSAQAERLLYFALVGAIEAGLVRTAEDALTVLRRASQPLGPMGAEAEAAGAGSVTFRALTRNPPRLEIAGTWSDALQRPRAALKARYLTRGRSQRHGRRGRRDDTGHDDSPSARRTRATAGAGT